METAAILGYMRGHNLVGVEWIAEYIAKVTNAYILVAALPHEAPDAVESFIEAMAREQQLGYPIRAKWVKEQLDFRLEVLSPSFRNGLPDIPLPENEIPLGDEEFAKRLEEQDRNKHCAELERYRSQSRNTRFADSLVMAAKEMEGWFHWVPGGAGEKTDKGEENHFVMWLDNTRILPAPAPDSKANLNCWEAILFAAYRAGLLSRDELRRMYREARKSGANCFHSLTDSLGYRDSFPYVPSVGLIPHRGDIVFFDREEHVALYMGMGKIMSHWKHPADGFRFYEIKDFDMAGIRSVKFGSMPL